MLHLSFNTYVYRRQDKALAEQEIKHKDAFALQEKRHDKALENLTLEKHDLLERMERFRKECQLAIDEANESCKNSIMQASKYHLDLAYKHATKVNAIVSGFGGFIDETKMSLETYGAIVTSTTPRWLQHESPISSVIEVRSGIKKDVTDSLNWRKTQDVIGRKKMSTKTVLGFRAMANTKRYRETCGEALQDIWQRNEEKLVAEVSTAKCNRKRMKLN
jgi:hypothetical protein